MSSLTSKPVQLAKEEEDQLADLMSSLTGKPMQLHSAVPDSLQQQGTGYTLAGDQLQWSQGGCSSWQQAGQHPWAQQGRQDRATPHCYIITFFVRSHRTQGSGSCALSGCAL